MQTWYLVLEDGLSVQSFQCFKICLATYYKKEKNENNFPKLTQLVGLRVGM